MRLSVAVMAHPARERHVAWLVDRLGIGGDRVAWDPHPAPSANPERRWATGEAAWNLFDPDADWHLVVQDDITACGHLPEALAKALDHVPTECAVSAYFGAVRPLPAETERIAREADRVGASWLRMRQVWWGQAIALPTGAIPGMVAWCRQRKRWRYDTRIGEYVKRRLKWDTWYMWPSLVDHAPMRSLIGNPDGRHAHRAHRGSALGLAWDGPVVASASISTGKVNAMSHDPFRPHRVYTKRRQPTVEPPLTQPEAQTEAKEPVEALQGVVPADAVTPQVHVDPVEKTTDETPPIPDFSGLNPEPIVPPKPTTRDNAATWRAYAAARGVEGAETMTKAQLVQHVKDADAR